jgi:hypothetical protein
VTDRDDPDTDFPDPLPIGYRLNIYLIHAELAPGRMGRIYKAMDTVLNQIVAVNVLARERRDPRGAFDFTACVRRAVQRKDAKVFDFGVWRGVLCAAAVYEDGVEPFADLRDE